MLVWYHFNYSMFDVRDWFDIDNFVVVLWYFDICLLKISYQDGNALFFLEIIILRACCAVLIGSNSDLMLILQ